MKLALTVFSFLLSLSFHAQIKRQFTVNSNGWYMYFGDHKVSAKWGIHLEAQLRRNELVIKPQQALLRAGINYHINPSVFVTAGYCFVNTYPYGAFAAKCTFPENRIWEQLQVKSSVGKFEMVNRFRLEQRFVNSPILDNAAYIPGPEVYSNRFRLLSRFSLPFKGNEIVDRSVYLSAYNEFFISFGKNVALNIFDQNRAYLALGYKIPKLGRLELGYLNQLVFKSDGIKVENNNTLQLSLISNINFYSSKIQLNK